MSFQVLEGDCVEVMRGMDEVSVDALVTDPPYFLSFMGKAWDSSPTPREQQAQHEAWAREALRVLKPGGHLLAFGGTRTYHRMVCAIEDAGFEIRDTVQWIYGSGFPKSLNVGKAIDKMAGAEREKLAANTNQRADPFGDNFRDDGWQPPREIYHTAPATEAAQQWEGWGTALKPSHEPIVLARKPLAESSIARQVLATGTGALNVDGCRVEHKGAEDLATSQGKNPGRTDTVTSGVYGKDRPQQSVNASGRFPANLLLSHHPACNGECAPGCPVGIMDGQSGDLAVCGGPKKTHGSGGLYEMGRAGAPGHIYNDKGGASRFFQRFDAEPGFTYVPKASRRERNAGLEGMPEKPSGVMQDDNCKWTHNGKGNEINLDTRMQNTHPTVKPLKLMSYLCRLICPPGGTVLDPFAGSGSTGCAAVLEGFNFIGIEKEAEYAEIARRRIAHHSGDASEPVGPLTTLF